MKKQLLTLMAAAAFVTAAHAQCPNNGTVTRSWTGLGTTESVFDADNWSSSTVPDCDDNVTFNTGTKDARIPSSWEVKDILITNSYKGRIYVEGAGTVLNANSLDLTGTIFHFMTNTGHATFGTVTIGGNGMMNASSNAGMTINGTLNLTGAGFFSARFKSVVNLGGLTIGAYGQFKAPQEGRVVLQGNFAKHKMSTFDHRFSTFIFNGPDLQNYHFSTGSGTTGTTGTCQFWNVVINKTNNALNTSDDFTGSDNTDTMLVDNKLTLTDGDFRSGSNVKIFDTLDMVGVGAQGHNATFRMAGSKVADVICNSGSTNPSVANWTLSIEMQNSNRLVKVWKGSAASINLGDGIINVNTGKLQFDENVDATINEPITVTSTGQLVAPSSNRLNIGSYWNLAGRNTFEPRTGEVYINGAGNSSWNHGNSRVFFYDLFIDAPGENHIWGVSANDTLWIINDLDIIAGSPRSAVVVFEDDVTVHSGADPRMDEFVAHGGESNQDITVASVDQLKTNPIMINKTAGRVRLESDLNLNRLTLKNGNLDPDGYDLTITASNGIFGGNANSFIRGNVFLNTSTSLSGSRMNFPVGVGTKYRPILLHNNSGSNAWEVAFVDSDPSALGTTLNGGLVSLSADGYWTANRTAGGGGLLSDAAYFEIADAGKGSWNNSELRVAKFDGTSAWDNLGGTFTSDAVISTNNTYRSNTNFVIALAEDNSVPQPDMLVTGDQVSGKELRTGAASNSIAAGNNSSIRFTVYPNPANETLFITLSGANKGSITLSDMSGKVIGVYGVDAKNINVSQLAAGVYFATFSNGSHSITQRVIRN
jgi:hypothetical protein